MGSFLIRVPFRVLFIRAPYYIGDVNRDPNLENYPKALSRPQHELQCVDGLAHCWNVLAERSLGLRA